VEWDRPFQVDHVSSIGRIAEPLVQFSLAASQRAGRHEVIEQCRQRLAEYKLPRIVEFVERLPATITGKRPMPWRADESVR
jgi:acyl-CoA synthetase (AMP-forming)/AMP-acid ligase II